ncbi:hypothetical protein Pla8534_08730 [Lignipirellula cremea]|uniref:Uncharacterized protein n=1 Tax=Lignipirellula cremea TaxID=2528010 RepID=A0A518DMM3_9BACT|nr:hypothetical protein Pla8534_08730 [Lignipirellula cremea]
MNDREAWSRCRELLPGGTAIQENALDSAWPDSYLS